MERQLFSSGTPWEARAGYSRAVRVGVLVFVSGTTAADETGQIQHPDDAYAQAVYIYKKIEASLQALNANLTHVVRTRVYVVDMGCIEQVIQAHHEFFEHIRPANTLVEVNRLATPDMLVEIEVDAVVPE
jgi:enamine deaminase RidA (YjgF/YER057c/UK114 family)